MSQQQSTDTEPQLDDGRPDAEDGYTEPDAGSVASVDEVDRVAGVDLEQYRTNHGTVPHKIDGSDDEHPLKQVLGDVEHIEFAFDALSTGEKFAFRYDDPTAAFREYIANAETACIRRARHELIACPDAPDDVVPMELTPAEAIEHARTYTGYEPVIEIDHAAHESDFPAFQIRDNGIGISVEEFLVLRSIGLSASHDQGQDHGSFGQGVLSAYPLVGKHGDVDCVTRSLVDEQTYGFRMRIDGMNYTDKSRSAYGTTFTFPSFGYDVRNDIDVKSSVGEFSEGLAVPVLYREFDATDTEIDNEEYTPTVLSERYDAEPIVWEDPNGYVTAVMWPTVSNHSTSNAKTYNCSMPIDRNDKSYSSTSSYSAPYAFDLRLNYEDGRILHDPTGECTGLIPIAPRGYEQLDADEQDRHVPKDELTGDELRLPEPVDDRDRLKSGYNDTYRYISTKLDEAFYSAVRDDFEALADEGLEFLLALDEYSGSLFKTAWQKVRPLSTQARQSRVTSAFDTVGVSIDDETASEIASALRKISVAPRFDRGVSRKRNREEMTVLEYLAQYAPDEDSRGTTYMSARTIHSMRKAKLAWNLHEDNQVVVVGSAGRYETYADLFGWETLKSLSLYDILESHPELDEVTAKELERGNYFEDDDTDDEPSEYTKRTRPVTVRSHGELWTKTAGQVYDHFDADGSMQFGRETIEELVVLRQTDGHTAGSGTTYTDECNGVGRVVVPDYVADFLTELGCVHDGTEQLDRAMADVEVEATDPSIFGDGSRDAYRDALTGVEELADTATTTIRLGDIGSETVIVPHTRTINNRGALFGSEVFAEYIERIDDALAELDHDIDALVDAETVLFVIDTPVEADGGDSLEPTYYERGIGLDTDSVPVVVEAGGTLSGATFARTTSVDAKISELHLEALLPESVFPRDSPEWTILVRGSDHRGTASAHNRMASMVQTLAQLRPDEIDDDTEPVFASAQSE
jgi:hypothetical protein